MKKIISALRLFFRRAAKIVEVRYLLYAILTVLGSELLSTGPVSALKYPALRPLPFVAAVMIVMTSYALSLLFKRRIGVFIIIEGFWVGIAIANCVLLGYRVNPLSAVDFSILLSVLGIINVYLSVFQIILIAVAIVGAVALAVLCAVRLPKKKPNYRRVVPELLIITLLCCGAVAAAVFTHRDDMKALKISDAYREYGFIYCFSLSTSDRGIDRPGIYNKDSIKDILDGIGEDDTASVGGPNVIMVQLESFIDVANIKGLETSECATPNFCALKSECPSGTLTVPVSGAGTVNTEFEILCGIPISVFGLGEYPYETVLKSSPCESVAYYLAQLGYKTHSIHNHTGTFYNRYRVMEMLGFDTFTPVELMSGVRYNSLGWARDEILTDEIIAALKSTTGSDLVYTISVQPHGKYASAAGGEEDITVSGDFDIETLAAMKYYVNQLHECDEFVGELIESVRALGEDTVIVFFGDHQPSLGLEADDLKSGSLYTTEYVIWSNFELAAEDCDMASYELSSYLLELLDIDGGVISRFHRDMKSSEDYLTKLEELSYDLLFGEKYAYGGEFPYEVPKISYGVREISADYAYIHNDTLFIVGENMTEASVATVDGRVCDTVYISSELIVCPDIKKAASVIVAQVADDGTEFLRVSCDVTEDMTK